VYEGNLVLQERAEFNVATKTFTRGSDLSGSLQGAGGIGGLLSFSDHTSGTTYHIDFHADGNGNVTALVDRNQQVAARYFYDPFGNTLASGGPLADVNLYRFSTKELHASSGLIYYLYRYYDSSSQRWVNRDPVGELDGPNTYAFVHNRPGGVIDTDGRFVFAIPAVGIAVEIAVDGVAIVGAGIATGVGWLIGHVITGIPDHPFPPPPVTYPSHPTIKNLPPISIVRPIPDCRARAVPLPRPRPRTDECDKEWERARKTCADALAKPNPDRGLTGGYDNIEDCARGLVSEECGGNVLPMPKPKRPREWKF